ncbi:MAG: tetratricopeptide repeat protein [Bacteroidia bacterium]
MIRLISLFLLSFLLISGFAQTDPEADLAEKYFADGEYESALELFDKVYRKDPQENYGLRIVSCYEMLGQFEEGIKFLDKNARRQSSGVIFSLLKASLLEKTGSLKEADKLYLDVIDKQLILQGDFVRAGAYLYQAGKLELANKAYLQGRKRLGDPYIFSNEIANIHTQLGEFDKATDEYLNMYYASASNLSAANLAILNLVNPQSTQEVEKALLQAVDKQPNDNGLRSILYEYYVQAENFYEAFIQVKSIDRLFREDGDRIYNFAETMRNNKMYDLSNEAYDYIIERKKTSPYFYRAHFEKAVNGELKAFDQIPVDMPSVQQAVNDYGNLLKEFGYKPQYFDAIYRRAKLMIFYLNDLETARTELEEIVRQKQFLRLEDWAQGQLLIADVLLMQQEYNKAKLIYTDVSESFKDRQIGALAKFKLGQMAYYRGEFNLAQALLGAIKDNTSNDISNDAIKLNLLIIDNTGLDTTTTALEMFAKAQLLTYQRDYKGSLKLLDSLAYQFPTHTLADEILWERSNIFLKQNDISSAMIYIDRILNEFSTDIYGDDALYTKARIYDYSIKDPEAAMQYYMEFLKLFPGSLFSVEVRKRIRELRKEG